MYVHILQALRLGQEESADRAKHRVEFQTAKLVFDDPHAISILERVTEGEERWQTIGIVHGVTILIVALRFEKNKERRSFV
jgi:uncharacterized protein